MNILVPTDFSACANAAFNVACQIAFKQEAKLHLLHNADISKDDPKIEEVEQKALQELQALRYRAQDNNINCSSHFTCGQLDQSIENILNKVGIDLIVMGTEGTGGKEEWFVGSNTQKVARKYKKDLLVIKSPSPILQLKSAVFISSLNTEDQDAFKSFLEYTDIFGIKELHILTINTDSWLTQPAIIIEDTQKDFIKLAKGRSCRAHFYKNHSMQFGINEFMKEYNIDLAGISYRKKHPLKRIILGSNAEMLINRSKAPLLCINS